MGIRKLIRSTFVALLALEAELVLRKYKPKIVAITGSVGKTSTKEAIYTALSRFLPVRKSEKSFNSEFGIPYTILGVGDPGKSISKWMSLFIEGIVLILSPNAYPEWLVLEVGAEYPGDIENITKWLKPDVVVGTRLSAVPVHVEFFKTPEELYKEKGYLVQALKSDGILILNADDERVLSYSGLVKNKPILFGRSSEADVNIKSVETVYEDDLPIGINTEFTIGGESLTLPLRGTIGEHHAYPFAAALAVVLAVKENPSLALKSLYQHESAPGRMKLIEGVNGSLIIDDTYNSSPIAVEEALKTLKDLNIKGRKFAILGDMLELGKYSVDAHKEVGKLSVVSSEVLITVGVRSRYTAEEARNLGLKDVKEFDDSREAGEYSKDIIFKGDVILVKGSQSMRMERAVETIMAHPGDKQKLLVRQGKEWKKR